MAPLRLVDLRGDGSLRMGIPSHVARGLQQSLARQWSVAFNNHPAAPDGILYPSRLNGEINLAVYDRAVGKLNATKIQALMKSAGLAGVLDDLRITLV